MNKNETDTVAPSIALVGECMIEIALPRDGGCVLGYAGDTLNAAVYMARLGMRPRYVTAIGTDPHSDAMLAFWEREGIDASLVRRRADKLPGLYMISTDGKGERQFHYWRHDAAVRTLFTTAEDEPLLATLADQRLIYWSGISLAVLRPAARQRLFATMAEAQRRGGRVVFDTNFRRRLWTDMDEAKAAYAAALASADIVFTSLEDENPALGEADEAGVIARHQAAGVGESVIKNGRPGCRVLLHVEGRDIAVDAPPVANVVDTTAAGDSFAAAYLAARARGLAPEAAAAAGHRLAGAVVGVPGAILPRERMPARLLNEA